MFHWALFALMVVVVGGGLQRSEGIMGVAAGQTRPDAPASYGVLRTGPLHSWRFVHRSLRVDAFEPNLRIDGIDRGPTPTISLLDGAGKVVKTQRVYPNMPLQVGSFTVHRTEYGLAATVALLNSGGTEIGRSTQLIDFSETASDGTEPLEAFAVSGTSGKAEMNVLVSVPLDKAGGRLIEAMPTSPTVRVVALGLDGKPLHDQVLRPGQDLALPSVNGSLRLVSIGYYARLTIVDDWTIPLLYAAMVIATLGLTLTLLARQQVVVAAAVEGPDGVTLAMAIRLWRNTPTSRSEVEGELRKALEKR